MGVLHKIFIPGFSILLLLSLFACAPPPAAPEPFQVETIPAASPIPASPTPTPTQASTSTRRPTNTPAYTPTPAPNLAATAQVKRVLELSQPELLDMQISPDGQWRAELVRHDCTFVTPNEEQAYELLRLEQVEEGTEKLVADQLQNCGGLGAAGIKVIHWSSDSRYLYYTDAAEGVPDGGGSTGWYPPLFRYDLYSEEILALRWGPLASDGVTMAYPNPWNHALVLWDLDRGEIARQPTGLHLGLPEAGIKEIAWAPSDRGLAFIEAESLFTPTGKTRLVFLDFASFETRVLYETEDALLYSVIWQSPNQIGLTEVKDGESTQLTITGITYSGERPASLWCEGDDHAGTRVYTGSLPGAPASFCIRWEANSREAIGYRVELVYDHSGERFEYTAGPLGSQWIVPFEYWPRLNESQEQFRRRSSIDISVYALLPVGERLVDGMAMQVDNFDLPSLPTATPVP